MLETMLATLKKGSGDPGVVVESLAKAVAKAQTPDGGFPDRSGEADLYYAAFALKLLTAVGGTFDHSAAANWTASFKNGEDLDLVHFSCLVRCRVLLKTVTKPFAEEARKRLESSPASTLYNMLMTLWASDDLNLPVPSNIWPDNVWAAQTPTGGFANSPSGAATTPTTAAAFILLNRLGESVPENALNFLIEQYHDGAFRAAPIAPGGDLLSTSVALQCLSPLPEPLDEKIIREFLLSTQTPDGLFGAVPCEQSGDVEYAFYGLLGLGRLRELQEQEDAS